MCTRKAVFAKIKEKVASEHFFGASPAPFIGRHGYPFVNVGILSPGESGDQVSMYDAPESWARDNLSISKVVDYRSALVNSRAKATIKGTSSRTVEIAREVTMSSKPVDVEIDFLKVPKLSMSFNQFSAPTGPSAEMKSARIASTPKIHHKVEKVFSDTDLKAAPAVNYLFKSGFDVNFISKLLSVSTMGLKSNRRLVPTRFSITATDDIIGKEQIAKIKDFNSADTYEMYFGGYMGNYFMVMFFPRLWSYELFEAFAKGDDYATDYESFSGRTYYADNTAGGYYAARLPVLEKLIQIRRQASVLVIRMITDEYTTPLGVWVVREAVRKAVQSKPIEFASKELMLRYAELLMTRKFGYKHSTKIISSSELLASLKQTTLSSFV